MWVTPVPYVGFRIVLWYFEGVKNGCVQQINIKLIISEGNYLKKSKNWPFFDQK